MIYVKVPEPEAKPSVTDKRTTTTRREVDAVSGEVNYVNEEHVDSRVVFIPAALLPESMEVKDSYSGEVKYSFKPNYGEIRWQLMGQRRGQPYWYGGHLEVKGYRLKKDGRPGQVCVEKTYFDAEVASSMPENVRAIAREYDPGSGAHPYQFEVPELEPVD